MMIGMKMTRRIRNRIPSPPSLLFFELEDALAPRMAVPTRDTIPTTTENAQSTLAQVLADVISATSLCSIWESSCPRMPSSSSSSRKASMGLMTTMPCLLLYFPKV